MTDLFPGYLQFVLLPSLPSMGPHCSNLQGASRSRIITCTTGEAGPSHPSPLLTTQNALLDVITAPGAAAMEVTQLFTFWRPQNECKSAKLRHLTHKQHDILYAVSGCSDVKFRIGNLNEAVRPDSQGQGRGGAVQMFEPQRTGAGFSSSGTDARNSCGVSPCLLVATVANAAPILLPPSLACALCCACCVRRYGERCMTCTASPSKAIHRICRYRVTPPAAGQASCATQHLTSVCSRAPGAALA